MGSGSSKNTHVVPIVIHVQNGKTETRKEKTNKELQIQTKKSERTNVTQKENSPVKGAKLEILPAKTSKELQIQAKKSEEINKKAILPAKRAKLEEEVPPAAVNIFDVLHGKVPVPDQAPVPESVEDLDVKVGNIVYVPEEPGEPLLTIEDTFWSEKKRVMPDLKALKHVEDHALKVPSSEKSSPESLAAYLVIPCKTDIEKVRAIYWWITHNIKYDVRFLNTGIRRGYSPQEVLNSGTAICGGYANLCSTMMKSVGLEAEYISGTCKGAGYWPGMYSLVKNNNYNGAHAWNKVKIDGTWFLMDATWSAGACSSDTGKHKFNFKWNEIYFLVEPKGFIYDHLPLKSNLNPANLDAAEIVPENEVLQEPLMNFKTWEQTPDMAPICHFLGIKPVNYKKCVIYTKNNQVNIELSSRVATHMWVVLKKRSKKQITTLQNMTWISNNGKEIKVCARLQGSGIYHLEIYGHPWRLEKQPDDHRTIWVSFKYTIVGEGVESLPKFPDRCKTLGPTLRFLDAGFKIIKPSNCVIETVNGYASVVIEMPNKVDLTLFWVHIYKNDTPLPQNHLLVERSGKYAIVHVTGLGKGEYLLDLSLPSGENKGIKGASFLIESNENLLQQNDQLFPSHCTKLMGPQKPFLRNDIAVLYPKQSTIYAKNGQAMIITREKTPINTFVAFTDLNGNRINKYVSTKSEANLKYYSIIMDHPGMYLMKICMPGFIGAVFLVVYPNNV